MLYSEKELEKCLKAGCALYYFYASDEALVHTAAQKTLKYLNRDDPETTVLDGPTPSVEEIVLAAGTISFFGGKRLVLMPLIRPSTYSDKDLQELCDTLADTENAAAFAGQDKERKAALEALNAGEAALYRVNTALGSKAGKALDRETRTKIKEAERTLERLLKHKKADKLTPVDVNAINTAREALSAVAAPLVARWESEKA